MEVCDTWAPDMLTHDGVNVGTLKAYCCMDI